MTEIKQQGKATPKPTPLHARSYLGSLSFSQTPASHPHPHLFQDQENEEIEGVIYGTNISVKHIIRLIQRFITTFEVTFEHEDQCVTQKVYLAKLRDLENIADKTSAETTFEIDAQHLNAFSRQIYHQLIFFPVEMISCFDMVLQNLFQRYFLETETNFLFLQAKTKRKEDIRVGIVNLGKKDKMSLKNLAPLHLGRLVSVKGLVVRVSDIYPQMKAAYFRCLLCKNQIIVFLENAKIKQPSSCSKCLRSECLQLMHNHCKFTNKQYIKFQQLLENTSEGHAPSSCTLIIYDSNADRIKPGDAIEAIGIYRSHPMPVQRGKMTYRTIFNTYIDLISFELIEHKSQSIKQSKTSFSDYQVRQFFKMANKTSIIQDLASSFAPSIFGNRQVKKGVLAQLFGPTKKTHPSRQFRSQINICLVGDPSTAKSQILQQVHRIAPRSIYTCGKGSSAVGLTVSVKKDPETKEFVLQSGALVLSDQGICCIDQFDKMDPNTRTVLLQVMEQQTISIAKAGIVCQLNSRTAILAAANPKDSKFNTKKSLVENIDLPPTLLSRFDLIYILLDIANQEQDKRLAAHILNIYASDSKIKSKSQGVYSMQLLANYITFAREITAIVGEAAAQRLKAEYTKMRSEGKSNNTISATPRLLESMIRLSQAFAKMRLSNEVSVSDVEQAIHLIEFATLKSATDPETGIVDFDILAIGRTSTMQKRSIDLGQRIGTIMSSNEAVYSYFTTISRFLDQYRKKHPMDEVNKEELLQALKVLSTQDQIIIAKNKDGSIKFKLKNFNQP